MKIIVYLFLVSCTISVYAQSSSQSSHHILPQEQIIEFTNLEGKVFYLFNGTMEMIPADKLQSLSVTEYTDLQGNTYRSYDGIHWAQIEGTSTVNTAQSLTTIPASDLYMENCEITPNPASRLANFRLTIKKSGSLTITLQSATGSFSRMLFNGQVTQGQFDKSLDISKVPNGSYTCIFEINGHSISKNIVITP